jgi:hypothetical protein
LAGAGGAAGFAPLEASEFSVVHFGGGGFAGLAHDTKKITADRPQPKRNGFRSLI